MTAPVKPVDAWAVVGPDANIMPETIRCTRRDANFKLFDIVGTWLHEGYRCVRVTVAVKEGGE